MRTLDTDRPSRFDRASARRGAIALLCVALVSSRVVAETASERLERAKSLFREGNTLLGAGDPERALERFLQSREAVASGKNTANAAICLERLGRYDEALEMYEELLARFSKDLDDQDRSSLVPIMTSLRARLGSLDISSNVEGLVIVDGRPRGTLPRSTALRVVAGKRRLRVVKEGYQSFDREIEVTAGALLAVDTALEPLRGLGALRVEHSGRSAQYLVVDGKPLGLLPWEGTLPIGAHLLQAMGDAEGSVPTTVRVLERKTLLIRLTTLPLGEQVRIEASPRTAALSLADGTELGAGFWAGRLPVGTHVLDVSEPGYFASRVQVRVDASAAAQTLKPVLLRNPADARWPQPDRWLMGVRAVVALAHAPTLNGDSEAACPEQCVDGSSATGAKVEAAFEVMHRSGLGVEAAAGYHFAHQSFTRALMLEHSGVRTTYALRQTLALGGVFARLAGVAELRLPWRLELRTSAGVGVSPTNYEASASGLAWTTGEFAAATGFDYTPISEVMPFVTSNIDVQRAIGPVVISLGLGVWFVPTRGPTFPDAQLGVVPNCDEGAAPGAVGCVPASAKLSKEPVHGAFALLAPEIGARYRF